MKTPIFRGLGLVTLVVLPSPACNLMVVFSDPTVLQPETLSHFIDKAIVLAVHLPFYFDGVSQGTRVLETDPGPCQSLPPSNPSIPQYSGSSSLQGFVVSGGKRPKFLVLNMTLNQNASAVLPAWEKVVLPWASFPFVRTDCILQTLVCAWHWVQAENSRQGNEDAELSFFTQEGMIIFFPQIEAALSFLMLYLQKKKKKGLFQLFSYL